MSSRNARDNHRQVVNKIPFSEILQGNCITALSLDQMSVLNEGLMTEATQTQSRTQVLTSAYSSNSSCGLGLIFSGGFDQMTQAGHVQI